MARVSDEVLEQLKRDVSVRRLAEAKGVSFKKSGDDNYLGRCPFHEDETASLVVSEKKNLWHCLGACRAGGSVVDFVMKAEGVNFRHAVELLREGVDLSGPVGPRVATVPKLPSPVDAAADDAALLAQVRDYYHQQLKASPEALAYLEKRGLKHEGLIDTFKLGFANRTLGLRLPDANRAQGAQVRGRLQALGVLRSSGHEHLSGSLVVPLHDEGGQVVGMYGRKVTPNLRPGTPNHLYLAGPHRAAFNSAGLAGQRTAIICEALIDAMSFWAAGFRNVTATYGVDGFTAHHLEALRRHGVKDVLIAFDRDEAGDAGADALAKRLMGEGFECWRLRFPWAMDANDVACKVKPAAKSLALVLRQAAWMGKGLAPATPDVAAVPQAAARRDGQPASPLAAVPAARSAAAPATAAAGALEGERRAPVSTAARVSTAVAPAKAVPGALDTLPAAPTAPASTAAGKISPPPITAASSSAVPTTTAAASTSPALTTTAPAAPPADAPASVLPVAPKAPDVEAEVKDEEVLLHFGPRRYRVRGLSKSLSAEALKVNLLVSQGEPSAGSGQALFHIDTLDMYSARQRAAFLRAASDELRVPEDALKLGLIRSRGHC